MRAKLEIAYLGIETSFLRTDGSNREVFLLAPLGWDPHGAGRHRGLRGPSCGPIVEPVAACETLHAYSFGEQDSVAMAGLKFQVSTFDPCLFSGSRAHGGAVGVLTTHNGDVLVLGDWDAPHLARRCTGRRFWYFGVQRGKFFA